MQRRVNNARGKSFLTNLWYHVGVATAKAQRIPFRYRICLLLFWALKALSNVTHNSLKLAKHTF